MTKILGVCGQIGSGKDTAASYLEDEFEFTHLALAWPLKWFAYDVFGFTKVQLWGPSDHRNALDERYSQYGTGDYSYAWTDAEYNLLKHGPTFLEKTVHCLPNADLGIKPPPYHVLYEWFKDFKLHNGNNVSPRTVLQSLGTDWGREQHDEIWLYAILREIAKEKHTKVVISDVRFANEVKFIQEHGGKVLKIYRPDTDEKAAVIGIEGHKSEAEQKKISDNVFDAIIVNNRTLNEFRDSLGRTVNLLF